MMMATGQPVEYLKGRFGQFEQESNIMAFVNELIPEEQKDKFPFPVYIGYGGSKPTLYKWTIDRQRNAYLVLVNGEGGGYEGTPVTKHFVLNWDGNLISLSADPLGTSKVTSGVVMSWRIRHLVIPPALQSKKEEVIALIREAFSAMGDIYDGEKYVTVNVDFDNISTL
jgi:hypothetical protein